MLRLLISMTALFLASVAVAEERGLSQTVDGVTVYLGVIPSEIVRGHPAQHSESRMHGSAPKRSGSRHIVVALFDAETAERITDATVTARVEQVGLSAQYKDLEPMKIANTVSYGNFFDMPTGGLYTIKVSIKKSGAPHTIQAKFEYRS